MVSDEASPDANVIWGVAFDDTLDDEMRITIIATGFDKKPDDPYYRNQEFSAPVKSVVETPVEIKVEPKVEAKAEPVVEAPVIEEPVVEETKVEEAPAEEVKPAPEKKIDVDKSIDFDNLWDVFRRK